MDLKKIQIETTLQIYTTKIFTLLEGIHDTNEIITNSKEYQDKFEKILNEAVESLLKI